MKPLTAEQTHHLDTAFKYATQLSPHEKTPYELILKETIHDFVLNYGLLTQKELTTILSTLDPHSFFSGNAWTVKSIPTESSRERPKASEVWQHFKGDWYRIQTVAQHTETDEPLVIYQCIKTKDDKKLGVDYARPLSMFLSEVDREKYPNSTEQYRFKRLF